jgi:hypothetical protein
MERFKFEFRTFRLFLPLFFVLLESFATRVSMIFTILITLGFSSWKVRMKCLSTFGA